MGNPFFGIFDYNFDGHTSWSERTTGVVIMNQVLSRSRKRQASSSSYSYSDWMEEDLLLREELDAWRDECEDGSAFGLYPHNYQSKAEYDRVLNKAKQLFKERLSQITISFTPAMEFGFEVECPALDALNAIKREDFPNQRTFDTACYLSKIQSGLTLFPKKSVRNSELRLCNFILNSPNILASKYLTPNSDFLLAQAVKENFRLPFEIPDEDSFPKTTLSNLIKKLAKIDPSLAWEVWHWCVNEFSPYLKFNNSSDSLHNDALSMLYAAPKKQIASAISYWSSHEDFCEQIFSYNPDLPAYDDFFVAAALENNSLEAAQCIFISTLMHPKRGPQSIIDLVDGIIQYCNYQKRPTAINLFREHLYPVIKLLDAKSITRSFRRWENSMKQ